MNPQEALAGLLERAGDSRTAMRQVVNAVAVARDLAPPWNTPPAVGAELLGDLSTWGVVELGEVRAALMSVRDRDDNGVMYTPPEVVEFMVRASMEASNLDSFAGRADALDYITIVDPATGPGVYLVYAARYVARWYAEQLVGAEPENWLIRAVLPTVMVECLYGLDLDPVSVDVAKSACWLEIGGCEPITFMNHNIVATDTLAADLDLAAPKLAKRWVAERERDTAYAGGVL